ncbi:hypothetical protein ACT3TY_15500 [Halomonas sp. AOP22-C1-8]|uniref:hypothetical protein n=1 Tax=Halomonas sp. AOP22-C1-8 TaxID=3457717 RepID=UPI0040344560
MGQHDVDREKMLKAVRQRLFRVYPGLEDGYESVSLEKISPTEYRGDMSYHFSKAEGGAYTTSILVKAKLDAGKWNAYIERGPDD